MAKDPALMFYTRDFLADILDMSMKERGQYITLICFQHQRGHLTKSEMQKVAGKLSDAITDKFIEDAEGKFYNALVEAEVVRRTAYCEKQRDRASKRWGKSEGSMASSPNDFGDAMAMPRHYHGSAAAMPYITATATIEPGITRELEKNDEGRTGDKRGRGREVLPENPFSGCLGEAVADWLAYKREKRQPYKPVGLKSLFAQITSEAEKHGDEAVAGVIRASMAANYQGIIFDRLREKNGPGTPRAENRNVFLDMLREEEARSGQG